MNNSVKYLFFTLLIIGVSTTAFSQGSISNVSIADPYEAYRDSLKNTPYPWTLPVLGAKIREQGFDIPYPSGIGVNYAFSRMQLVVSDLDVGFSEDNLTNVDGFARFRSIKSDVNAYTARYDFWLLPFLNFYAIGGYVTTKTYVNLGLPFEINFQVDNSGTLLGWGTVLAGGVGPLVLSADFTMGWTFIPSLDKPASSIVAGGRGGYMFRFRNKPQRNLVILVGAQYLRINQQSQGSADLENLAGITPEGKQEALEQLNFWYEDLPEGAQKVLEPVYNGLSGWLGNPEPTQIYYKFNKTLIYPVSMSVGFNFQINKRYNLTALYSFLGSRDQVVVGFNYRFGWRGKNFLHGVTL